jgi:hypothetical protein
VEETLNAMLDAEADRLCRAERYQRTEARQDTRAGREPEWNSKLPVDVITKSASQQPE